MLLVASPDAAPDGARYRVTWPHQPRHVTMAAASTTDKPIGTRPLRTTASVVGNSPFEPLMSTPMTRPRSRRRPWLSSRVGVFRACGQVRVGAVAWLRMRSSQALRA